MNHPHAVSPNSTEQQTLPGMEPFAPRESTYFLRQLEVFNWGPFAGLHVADIDPQGTAVIGPTGSGKTTLIDGLMTLLVHQPRYNLASTGGHESDRTLISYVRGVLGGDGSDGNEEVARPGKTITGICATYFDGRQQVKLAGILWTDGPSNAAPDLKKRWIFSQADSEQDSDANSPNENQSLESWIRMLHENNIRELMRHGRETGGLRIFDSKKAYLAHTRKFFDVSENAFTLLNRAAGLKQLNSIDEIFRELVLDDHTAFDRALEVAAEFDNLAGIHAELETARRQQAALEPVAIEYRKLEKSQLRQTTLESLKQILPIWYAIAGRSRWAMTLKLIEDERQAKQTVLDEKQQLATSLQAHVDTLLQRFLKLGGDAIGELENTLKLLSNNVADRRKYANDYLQMIRRFHLDETLNQSTLQKNQACLGERQATIKAQHEAAEKETLDANSEHREAEKQAADIELQLQKVSQRPGSNIPPNFHEFRGELASVLSVAADDLPYLAELIEVKPNEAAWRGAIERAIGSERLRILVPAEKLRAALRWINDRNNRLHVRLQEAKANDKSTAFFNDGFTSKLNFKDHPLLESAKELLARHDRHCVDSPEALQTTELGLTIEGTMSGSRGKFEKQDQRRLSDGWMTGFDNNDQLNSLKGQQAELRDSIKKLKVVCDARFEKQKQLEHQLTAIEHLTKLEFSTIDLPAAESQLADSEKRLAALLDPKSDTSQAKIEFDSESDKLKAIRNDVSQVEKEIARFDERFSQGKDELNKSIERIGKGLDEFQTALAEKHLVIADDVDARRLDVAERDAANKIDDRLKTQREQVAEHETRLVRLMEKAKSVDTGALSETGSDLQDIADYLERLRVLSEEALPEKQTRFLQYLNLSSDQGVTQLLSGIKEEVDAIEHRIEDLNRTLLRVDFRSGRYLQLQPQRIKHERLRAMEAAQRKLRSAALKDDQGESHYGALQELIEILRDAGNNRRQQGARALLDPRYQLAFFIVEVDRKSGDRSPPRTGSQSGSGGEKELMASHILTASLSYALCPAEANRPLYGTVVLDEAFSKSSPSAATRIIEALRIFKLHPIFVTPNKEIGLLKKHTRKVICVQRPAREASLASISWETLEGLARSQ